MKKDYQALYLKYKLKYINLKKLVGAADPIPLNYEEDSKNLHQILKNIFLKNACDKIKSLIKNSLDPLLQVAINVIMTTNCKTIIRNVNNEKKMISLIDNFLTIFIPLFEKFIVNKRYLSTNDMDKIVNISIDILKYIFQLNSVITLSVKKFYKDLLSVNEINSLFTPQIKVNINNSSNIFIENYDEDKQGFTDNVSTCLYNSISSLSSNMGIGITAFACNIPGLKPILKIITETYNSESRVAISNSSLSDSSSSKKHNIESESEKNRINTINNKISNCISYIREVENTNSPVKQQLISTKQKLENAKRVKSASHKNLVCNKPSRSPSPKGQRSPSPSKQNNSDEIEEKNRINNINNKIKTCENYLREIGNTNSHSKQQLINTKKELEKSKKVRGSSHRTLVCNKPSSPSRGQRSPSPSRGQRSPSPSRGQQSPSPSRGQRSPSPSRGQQSPSPSRGQRSPSPSRGQRSPSPSRGQQSPSPSRGQQSPSPSRGQKKK